MAGIYTREKSSSDSESTNCHASQTKTNNKKCFLDMVSKWTTNTVEHLGLFYYEEPTSLHEFKILLSSSDLKFVSGAPAKLTHLLKDQSKQLLDTLVDLTKHGLNVSFSTDENKPDFYKGTVKKETSATRRALWEKRENIDNEHRDDDGYTADLVPKESGLSRFQLQTCYYHTYDFLKTYLHFLENGYENTGWNKADFRTLLSQFFTIFMLSPQPGKSNKRNQVLGGVSITSIPELRVVCYGQFPLTLGVVTVKDEKLTMTCDLDVYSAEEIPADALGQHAGELLLDYEYSVFDEAVFGILCFRTKLIFTFLKLSNEHFHSILNHKDQSDICACSTIYYTRPYDYLIKEHREAILELLFWLGLQTSSI